jgi:hypothetical protein
MAYLGRWNLGNTLTFYLQVKDPVTTEPVNADSAPTYRVYVNTTSTPLLTGTMSLVDSANATGFYGAQIVLATGSGFTNGQQFVVRKAYAVASIAQADEPDTWQILP